MAREGTRVRDVEPIALNAIAEQCWRHVATDDATLQLPTERTIHADRSRLQQLLENLYRNAIDHGGAGVTVTVGNLSDGFYVADDGLGIPDTERDTVFNVGYSTTDDGTGFGLSIVQQVADSHGWHARITDGPSGGARFEFTNVDYEE